MTAAQVLKCTWDDVKIEGNMLFLGLFSIRVAFVFCNFSIKCFVLSVTF